MDSSMELSSLAVLFVNMDEPVRQAMNAQLAAFCLSHDAVSMAEAQALFKAVPLHVAVIHTTLPDGDGFALCEWIAQQYPETICLLFDKHPNLTRVLQAINSGHVRYYLDGAAHPERNLALVMRALLAYQESITQANEWERLRTANQQLERKIELTTRDLVAMNDELRLMLDKLQTLSVTDEQTGLFNRRLAIERLDGMYKLAHRYRTPLSCLVCDIADFKRLNDMHGHDDGDRILSEVAKRILCNIRNVDIACRTGGDEFLIILPQTSGEQTRVVAERLYHVMETPIELTRTRCHIRINIGIAEKTPTVDSALALLTRAEEAEFHARHCQEMPPIVLFPESTVPGDACQAN